MASKNSTLSLFQPFISQSYMPDSIELVTHIFVCFVSDWTIVIILMSKDNVGALGKISPFITYPLIKPYRYLDRLPVGSFSPRRKASPAIY